MRDDLPGMPGLEPPARAAAMWLRDIYLPRIERALEVLPDDALWWRPHAGTNGVGDLLLHLEGNVRQWILSGLGGAPDARDRGSEFDRSRAPEAARPLMQRLRETVERAADLIESLDATALATHHVVQGYEVSGLNAVWHVVEHFSWHAGQIAWIAKHRAGTTHGLAYFDDRRLGEPPPGPTPPGD